MSDSRCSQQSVGIPYSVGFDDEYLAVRSAARLLITLPTSERVEIAARRIRTASVRTDLPFTQERTRLNVVHVAAG